MAAGLLRRMADADVESAGLLAGGMPATDHARAVVGGLDDHVSRTVTADLVRGADLVLGMERRHVLEAVVLVPEAVAWSFTVKDLARRAEPRRAAESLRAWAARIAADRPRPELLGSGDDEISDPIGQPRRAYERTASELRELLSAIVDAAGIGLPAEVRR